MQVDVIQHLEAWQLLAEILKALERKLSKCFLFYIRQSFTDNRKETRCTGQRKLELLIPDMLKEHLQNHTNILLMPNKYDDQKY